jgi:hypothetical protein
MSSVAMLPVALRAHKRQPGIHGGTEAIYPGENGQPPSPPTALSSVRTPSSSAARAFATPMPYVS